MRTTDEGDFERLVREHQRVVFQIAFGVLGNGADAEEVVQETFLRAYQRLPDLRAPERFRSWICRIGQRLALNRRRAAVRARQRDDHAAAERDDAIDVETMATDRAFEARVRAEIERMPEKLRAVMLLCSIEGLDHAAVADALGIPPGTVRSRLFHARRHLLKVLGR